MSILVRCYADCLRRLIWPILLICPLTWLTLARQPKIEGSSAEMATAMGLWLHLPAMLLTAAAIAAILESWPLLSRGRPGAKHLERLPIGPLRGCGVAITAALLSLACGLIIIALCFDWVMQREGRDQSARAIAAAIPAEPDRAQNEFLDARMPAQSTLHFLLPDGLRVDSLQLRPQAVYLGSGEFEPTVIQVYADEQVLSLEPLSISGANEVLNLDFPSRQVQSLEIRALQYGSFQVSFPAGSIVSRSAREFPSWLNCMIAALSYLFPAALSLAVLCLVGRGTSYALSLALALVILLASSLAGLTPHSAALEAYSRSQWIPSASLGSTSLVSMASLAGLLLIAIPARLGGRA